MHLFCVFVDEVRENEAEALAKIDLDKAAREILSAEFAMDVNAVISFALPDVLFKLFFEIWHFIPVLILISVPGFAIASFMSNFKRVSKFNYQVQVQFQFQS